MFHGRELAVKVMEANCRAADFCQPRTSPYILVWWSESKPNYYAVVVNVKAVHLGFSTH
jgi:hypothetical protein